MMRSGRSSSLRWPLLVMLIGIGSVALAGMEVRRSVRSNQELAERAQAGYARFVLWSYREHLSESIRSAAREVLGAVNHGDAEHVSPNVPPAWVLGRYLSYIPACDCLAPRFGPIPKAFLGFTVGADTIGIGPNFYDEPTSGWLIDPREGLPLSEIDPPRMRVDEGRWLSGLFNEAARDGYSDWGYRMHVESWEGEPRFFLSTLMPMTSGDTIMYAAEYSRAAIDTLLNAVFDDPGLLPIEHDPTTIPQRWGNRDVLSLQLLTPDATPLLSWAVPDRWTISAQRMPVSYGGLMIQAEIAPSMIDELVIGGLPRNRTPLLLALLGFAAALTVVAIVQLRREMRFVEARDDFVANVSHELRTPLTQIRLVLDTLGERRGDPESRLGRGLGMIDREVLRLQHLAEGVLRFRRGGDPDDIEGRSDSDIGLELREIVDEFRPLAASRSVTLSLDAPVGVVCSLEPGALRQLSLNILDNAVKYGPQGQQIRVLLTRDEGFAQLVVEDQGSGISEDEARSVWKPYFRGAAAKAGAIAGSGIGLTVVHDLVTRHRGTVVTEANPGGPSRVVVRLPVVEG